jgi:excisionase family DNA binding protein
MSDTHNPGPNLLGEALMGAIRQAVREEIRAVRGDNGHDDRLLTAEEAAEVLSVSPDWLYRHSKKLPFTRKLGPKMLRFSYQGILKWLATRKFS